MLKFDAGEEKAYGKYTGVCVLITTPTSTPKAPEKGILPEVSCDSKMTSQMQIVKANTCFQIKKKKKRQGDYSQD